MNEKSTVTTSRPSAHRRDLGTLATALEPRHGRDDRGEGDAVPISQPASSAHLATSRPNCEAGAAMAATALGIHHTTTAVTRLHAVVRNSSEASASAPQQQLGATAFGASSSSSLRKAGLVGAPRRPSAMALRPRAQSQGGWGEVGFISVDGIGSRLRSICA